MASAAASAQAGLAQAIALYNAGQREQAETLCLQCLATTPGPQPALQQLLAVICQERGDAAAARAYIEASLAARPDHVPSLLIAALACQDQRDLGAAESALMQVLRLQPGHVPAAVNLGIVQLEQGRLDDAMRAFGRAWRQRPETFGRIANALCSERCGALWLDLDDLRAALGGTT